MPSNSQLLHILKFKGSYPKLHPMHFPLQTSTIYFHHTPFSLLAWYIFFKHSFMISIPLFHSQPTKHLPAHLFTCTLLVILHHSIHIYFQQPKGHNISLSHPTILNCSLTPFYSDTRWTINIHALNSTQQFIPHIIHSQHLPQSFSINPAVCLLQIYKIHIYSAFFLSYFLTYLL